ncbi:hypothetical protein EXS74_00290 [Candidatus Woesearchaeota archaeon]|nr:hypothetical protein [Candidatus Woesearchaeota archaeon]
MVKYDFWDDWKNKNSIEESAIEKVKSARKKVIAAIPQAALVAIYIKGSFTRREMKEGSDVDMVPIVTENDYEGDVFSVNSPEIDPVCVVPLSLWELKNNQLCTEGEHSPDLRAKPDRFLKKLSECKLIYGKALNVTEFLMREDKHALQDGIRVIREGYIRAFESRKIEFSPLLKEVFWLVELEQNVRGIPVTHSFEGITQSVRDKTHLVHEAFKFRMGVYKTDDEKKVFIAKLKRYLSELEQLTK